MATRSKWRANQLAFYDNYNYETVMPCTGHVLMDDFLGDTLNADLWTGINTANATFAVGNPASCAVGTLLVNGETQDAGVYGNDSRSWNIDHGCIFEARVRVAVAPTIGAEVMIGMIGEAYNSGSNRILNADEVTIYAAFGYYATGGTGLLCEIRTDDAGVNSGIVSTATTVVATAYHIYRIDFTDPASVKFYIDGASVADGTTFVMTNGANIRLQPVVVAQKVGVDAGLGTVYIDYIRCWQNERLHV